MVGPLFFLSYINNLPNCNFFSDVRMYPDETKLDYASKDHEEYLFPYVSMT